jgi:hypothetical protein
MPKFYLSFADDTGSLGGTIVEAENNMSAVREATRLGINPGGEAAIIRVPEPYPPHLLGYLNRLVSREELLRDGGRKLSNECALIVCEECNEASNDD